MRNLTTTQKAPTMKEQILQHGKNLNEIFNTGLPPYVLCKKLFAIERKIHIETCAQCNGSYREITPMHYKLGLDESMRTDEVKSDAIIEKLKEKAFSILFPAGAEVNQNLKDAIFVNYDGRGYALKIQDKYMRENNIKLYSDWGGYGILAPEFN